AAPAPAAEQQGQVVGVVRVAVAQSRREQNHRVVENGGLALFHLTEPLQEICVLRDVPAVDELVLAQFLGIVLVVRSEWCEPSTPSRKLKFWLLTELPNMNVAMRVVSVWK